MNEITITKKEIASPQRWIKFYVEHHKDFIEPYPEGFYGTLMKNGETPDSVKDIIMDCGYIDAGATFEWDVYKFLLMESTTIYFYECEPEEHIYVVGDLSTVARIRIEEMGYKVAVREDGKTEIKKAVYLNPFIFMGRIKPFLKKQVFTLF